MIAGGTRRHYVSYLLRLWQTQRGGRLVWQASLESPRTGERKGFGSLADLCVFLERETERADQHSLQPPKRAEPHPGS